jgi:hypothetical protein
MPLVRPFYSVKEALNPRDRRVYHNNSACPSGRDIPPLERKDGTANYRLCDDCLKLTSQGS